MARVVFSPLCFTPCAPAGQAGAQSGQSGCLWTSVAKRLKLIALGICRVRKYWHVINVGIQNTLVYRVNFLFRSVFGLIPLMATIFLWRAVYAAKEDSSEVAGYTLSGMISYYLLITIVDMFTAVADDDWQIASDIREGRINHFLLKPIDYLVYRLCLFSANRVVYAAAALVPVTLFILFQRHHMVAPVDSGALGWFIFSMVLTGLLQFFMSYTVALLAFWVLEVSTFIFILFAFEYIAGGHLFPLDILPGWLAQLLNFTPFPYQLFFPVSIYLGRTSGAALWQGLGIQMFWVVFFYLIARWMWARGIRRFTAFGG
jgi:ABC-2 type transport system permease protein